MSEYSLRLTREIAAPPAAVWRILTDLEGAKANLPGITGIEILAGDGYDVGTRWRETRKMMGMEATEEMEVAAIEHERSTRITAASHGMLYTTTFELTPNASGTTLSMDFHGVQDRPNWVAKVIGRLTHKMGLAATRKAMLLDLDAIAAAAEAEPAA